MRRVFRQLGLVIVMVVLTVAYHSRAQQPCLQKAWAAFNKGDYPSAIAAADECISDFGGRATKEQARLLSVREPHPPTGAVDNAADRRQIHARWAINDVATAYFIKGRASEYLWAKNRSEKYKTQAVASYAAAAKLTYGRCWDSQGWFWSPAETSQERLDGLK
jgi:hypothetical protein